MKTAICILLAAVTSVALAAEPRPKTPDAATLKSPTSQIAAWYRYAIDLEAQLEAAKATPPPAATGFLPVAVFVDGQSGPVLTWFDNSSDEEGFRIERSADDGATWTIAGTTGPNVRIWQDGSLPSGRYFYRVRAFKGTQTGSASNAPGVNLP